MKKVLIIFGSKSDEKVYNGIVKVLKKAKIDFDLRVSSAHKTPEDVDKTLQNVPTHLLSETIQHFKCHKNTIWTHLSG